MKKIVALIFLALLIASYFYGYKTGSEKTRLHYMELATEQATLAQTKERQLMQALSVAKQETANSVVRVEQHFIPVDREVIRYVTREKVITCQPDHTEWMQLHNLAASGASEAAFGR
ncbi:hypothetical protein PVK63_06385 [Aliivibrio sp. S2TY2]|uniref:hypothetical protein n=1 Tax=unclassified Aliivibrio TaxID=2645654 RepID=UPI002378E833|nr:MULTISPECIES: hypothetical protein [unclassified Aliivibrio]MDD9174498.1 hypothetical protein [Aliivibrio sp. S3TY1]MDD9191576.1 hypothetical protein [Aliivibrio sp. S2TY2]